MNARYLIPIALCWLYSLSASAVDVEVPHTFAPNTPAKSGEVNENFNSIVQALAGLQTLQLYQDGVRKGKSLLLNVMKLESGYLTIPFSRPGDPRVFLTEADATRHFSALDCTGPVYIKKPVTDLDIHAGEIGYVFALKESGQAFVSNLPFAPQQVLIGSRILLGPTYINGQTIPKGTCLTFGPETMTVFPVIPNDPSTTGLITVSCQQGDSPAVCLPNAQLIRE